MSLGSLFKKAYKFAAFRVLLPFSYFIRSRKKVNEKKAVFIEVRFDGLSDNFALIEKALREEGYETDVCNLKLGYVSHGRYTKNCLKMIKAIGDARCVFLNEASSAYGSLNIRKETVTIQTWHACGAFKKFGISLSDQRGGCTEEDYTKYPFYRNNDFITVSSPEVVWAYEEAMSIGENDSRKVVPVGVSRTDVYYDKDNISSKRETVETLIPQTKGKKIILYAPTFRGKPSDGHIPMELDVEKFRDSVSEDSVLLIKHHPLGREKQEIPASCKDFAFDITSGISIETALMASDICITDYSSLVFEYSLLERPLIFFAFDIDDYIDERGFYYPFEEFCPGPIVKNTEELAAAVNEAENTDLSEVRAFKQKFMCSCDGHATERIVEIAKNGKRSI